MSVELAVVGAFASMGALSLYIVTNIKPAEEIAKVRAYEGTILYLFVIFIIMTLSVVIKELVTGLATLPLLDAWKDAFVWSTVFACSMALLARVMYIVEVIITEGDQ